MLEAKMVEVIQTEQNLISNNTETVFVTPKGAREAKITEYHWTALKLTNSSSEREMVFGDNQPDNIFSGGLTKTISCVLTDGITKSGETAKVRFVRFDSNYLKYQFVTLFRQTLFECCQSNNSELELAEIQKLFNLAILEFQQEVNDLIDNSDSQKAIKAKDITIALKQRYASNTES